MKYIKDGFIDRLLERVDIVDVISSRIPLKRSGNSYMACCPFHSEKSPSFSVNQSKQYFNCFGCHTAGSAIKFIQEYDHVSFVEAVEEVAKIGGIQVEYSNKFDAQKENEKITYEDLLETTTRFYEQELLKSKTAKDYLFNRGISQETIAKYHIGYAPDDFNFIKGKVGLNDTSRLNQLVELGVLSRNDRGTVFDTFRNRIIIPIRNKKGKTMAFGGRVLDNSKPKYINSKESVIYKKGNELFNLDFIRKLPRDELDCIMITEGYMDVIALDQFGVHNAVASLGTATTPVQLDLLFKQSDHIIFSYDGDSAGRKAAWHALDTALPVIKDNKQLSFCFLPPEHDPDSLVREQGASGIRNYLAKSISISEYIVEVLSSKYRVDAEGDKINCLDEALSLIVRIENAPIVQQSILQAVANLVEWPIDRVEGLLNIKKLNETKPVVNADQNRENIDNLKIKMTDMRQLVALLLRNPYLYDYVPQPHDFIELLKNYSDAKTEVLEDLFQKISQKPDIKTGSLLGTYTQTSLERVMNALVSMEAGHDSENIEVKIKDLLVLIKHLLVDAIGTRILYLKEKSRKEKLTNEEIAETTILERKIRDMTR